MSFQNLCLFNESFIFFSKLIGFIIKAYLGLQKKWNKKYKKFSNIHFPTYSQFSLLFTSCIGMVHLLQLMS